MADPTAAVSLPADPATILMGPIIGTDAMLGRLNARSADAQTLFTAMREVRLFGDAATVRSPEGDHPLIAVVLEWRDRYLDSAAASAAARVALEAVEAAQITDDAVAERVARTVARAIQDLARYETEINKTLDSLRKAVQDVLSWVQKMGATEAALVLEDVKRVRAELDLERKKIQAGVVLKVAETLRVSAGALMAERRRRALTGNGVPLGADAVGDDGRAAGGGGA